MDMQLHARPCAHTRVLPACTRALQPACTRCFASTVLTCVRTGQPAACGCTPHGRAHGGGVRVSERGQQQHGAAGRQLPAVRHLLQHPCLPHHAADSVRHRARPEHACEEPGAVCGHERVCVRVQVVPCFKHYLKGLSGNATPQALPDQGPAAQLTVSEAEAVQHNAAACRGGVGLRRRAGHRPSG